MTHHALRPTNTTMHFKQELNVDLTCQLELQTKECNKDNVVVANGTGIGLVGSKHTDIVACVSTGGPQCQELPVKGLVAKHKTGRNIAGPPTQIYLQSTRGRNYAQMHADVTPDWTQKRRQAADAAAVDLRLLKVAIVGLHGTGMLHYTRPVALYFATLPLCSSNINWASFLATPTMNRLQSIVPCKTRQAMRDNFIFLHPAELGVDFIDSTILAFFKSENGHNRAADMRTAQNVAKVSADTDTSGFHVQSMTEMKLSPNSGITRERNTVESLLVGDIFTHTPLPATPSTSVNITILVPDPLRGPVDGNYIIGYPSMQIFLQFPGVYTIIEDSMAERRGGKTLSSRSKTYLDVRKRTATPAQTSNTQIVTHAPLQYMQLANIVIESMPHNIATGHTAPVSVSRSNAAVVDGLTDDALFLLVQSNSPPCDRSAEWDRFSTNAPRSNASMDERLPCHITHRIAGLMRRVTYFRDITTRETYASYVDWARTQ